MGQWGRYGKLLAEREITVNPEVPVNVLHFTVDTTTSNEDVIEKMEATLGARLDKLQVVP